ncbi:MAG: Riboflavin biosynthesis protein RibD [Chlamydiae bacterium]|nr:Riboflavin biosynthesis protein RibD [Chlamydiota bacterium]
MTENPSQQQFFLQWALKLGEKGRLTAPPNPWVGCVLVKDGEIIGEGFHEAPGKPHAEIIALQKAGLLSQGATAYITLEPCSHYGRTPPCTEALIEAGIKKVVIPFTDPDPLVGGEGVKVLEKAGIEVIVGVAKEQAEESLASYLHHRRTGFPYVVLKAALSLDGRTAAADGSSKWITSEEARADVQRLRAESQAILVGAKTALVDKPRLTVRKYPGFTPLRVLLDRRGNVSPEGPLFDLALAPTLVATSPSCPTSRIEEWKEAGAEVLVCETLLELLTYLGKRDIVQTLVEGGGELQSSFLNERLANRLSLYYGNCLLGSEGYPLFPHLTIPSINHAPRLALKSTARLGSSMRLDYDLSSIGGSSSCE